jgi:hypothetical protein
MKIKRLKFIEYFIIIISVLFIFGCFATSYETARTEEPGQFAISGGYMRLENLENSSAEGFDLLNLNMRYGIAKGFDFSLAHTFDISSGDGSNLSTFWGDFKIQLSNRDNIIRQPTFSIGLIKGYVYDSELHITSLPLILSVPVSAQFTPTILYRFTLVSGEIIPTNFDEPRHEFALGLEYSFTEPSSEKWTPKIGFAIGTFNSLTGGDGDQGILYNIGITLESPLTY